MNRINVIGIGFRPLEKKAADAVRGSEIILSSDRLLEVFRRYKEYANVKDRIKVLDSVDETIVFIRNNYMKKTLSVLAAGDPMFFGIGRVIIRELGKRDVEVFPDISSVQAAFARIKEPWNNALLMSLHRGPDPKRRRKPEYEISELPGLLTRYSRLAVLTDRENSPDKIAGEIVAIHPDCKIYVCENLGYDDEKIIEGSPAEISEGSFSYPNVVVIIREDAHKYDDRQ